jgi:hypothetical protein
MTFWLVAVPVIVVVLAIAFLYDRRQGARRRRLGEAPRIQTKPIPELDPLVAVQLNRPHQG